MGAEECYREELMDLQRVGDRRMRGTGCFNAIARMKKSNGRGCKV